MKNIQKQIFFLAARISRPGFELETSHLTLNTLTNSPYLEFDKQRGNVFFDIHLQFYPLL